MATGIVTTEYIKQELTRALATRQEELKKKLLEEFTEIYQKQMLTILAEVTVDLEKSFSFTEEKHLFDIRMRVQK